MEKFPFYEDIEKMNNLSYSYHDWQDLWVVETESFLQYGGQIAKLLASLLLKGMVFESGITDKFQSMRPFVEWITVIIYEIAHSLKTLF